MMHILAFCLLEEFYIIPVTRGRGLTNMNVNLGADMMPSFGKTIVRLQELGRGQRAGMCIRLVVVMTIKQCLILW
jgi:hypothetical protein